MKEIFKLFPVLFAFFACSTYSATWNVQVADFMFTPDSLIVNVGDTIRWQWVSGFHTTTSLDIPDAALPWDAPIDNTNQVFSYVAVTPGVYNYKCTPHFPMMVGSFSVVSLVGITKLESEIADGFRLFQNYPNPFNPVTKMKFEIPEESFVQLIIYDALGRQVQTVVDEYLKPAAYEVNWDASSYPSGIYFYNLKTRNYSETKRMVLVK
jgi:plastocyanin